MRLCLFGNRITAKIGGVDLPPVELLLASTERSLLGKVAPGVNGLTGESQ